MGCAREPPVVSARACRVVETETGAEKLDNVRTSKVRWPLLVFAHLLPGCPLCGGPTAGAPPPLLPCLFSVAAGHVLAAGPGPRDCQH